MIPVRPRTIQLDASSACQLRCPACPTTSGAIHPAVGTGLLAFDSLRRLLDDNPTLRHIELSNYGEIFLNPALPDILRLCHERGVTADAANGTNLNTLRPEAIRAVVQHRMRLITVSIDGTTQDTYAKYRVRGRLDAVLANIVRINAEKRRQGSDLPRLVWQFIVFAHNAHELDDARAMAESLGMAFNPKLSWDDDLAPDDRDAIRAALPEGAANRDEFREQTGRDYAAAICHQLWDSPQVNWDGKLLGCCRNFWGDFGANVFTDGLVPAVNSDRMTHARAMLQGQAPPRDDIPCTTCDLYHTRAARNQWIRRDPVARGQRVTHDEALALAATWAAAGRPKEARALAETVLRAQPAHGPALRLLFTLDQPRPEATS